MHLHANERYGWLLNRQALTAIIIAVMALIIYALVGPEAPGKGMGVLEGTVVFIGLPCDGGNVPPCNGPYPNYKVIIYSSDGRVEVAAATTDAGGNYTISLPEGDYVVYSGSGPISVKKNQVSVRPGVTTRLDITLDTGVRRT